MLNNVEYIRAGCSCVHCVLIRLHGWNNNEHSNDHNDDKCSVETKSCKTAANDANTLNRLQCAKRNSRQHSVLQGITNRQQLSSSRMDWWQLRLVWLSYRRALHLNDRCRLTILHHYIRFHSIENSLNTRTGCWQTDQILLLFKIDFIFLEWVVCSSSTASYSLLIFSV